MAEEHDDSQKTEDPTQKRLDEAHDKGQIAVSRELNHWFMFGGGLIAVFVFGPQMVRDVAKGSLNQRPRTRSRARRHQKASAVAGSPATAR